MKLRDTTLRKRLGTLPSNISLRAQLAAGSALVALLAILVVALTAFVTVAISQREYQRSQLSAETSQLATTLGQASTAQTSGSQASLRDVLFPGPLRPVIGAIPERGRAGLSYLWAVDRSGQLIVSPSGVPFEDAQDAEAQRPVIVAALRRALQGADVQDDLPGSGVPLLTARFYVAVPVRAGGISGGPIIGAVALSSVPPRIPTTRASGATMEVLVAVALFTAVAAGGAAILFSRRLTRPLDDLTRATEEMSAGNYGARVDVVAPAELRRLATTFNAMAEALEHDISEIHRQEQLRRELVANVSHELATPLTMIHGYTEALTDGMVRDPAERDRTTRLIARETGRLRRMVDQLREVARYEAGAESLEREHVELGPLVEGTLAVVQPEVERKHITMRAELPEDLPTVYADADRVVEVLLNLIENAVRHTPPGGVIEIRGTREGAFVRVGIADSGPGVSPEEGERIFERFYRLDAARSSAEGGTGLGLAIVKALVEAHGGMISIGERPGGGSLFSFTLPLAPAETSGTPPTPIELAEAQQ